MAKTSKTKAFDDLCNGVIELDARASVEKYIKGARQQRVWN